MVLEKLPYNLTVCKVRDLSDIRLAAGFFFIGKTDEEVSLVVHGERRCRDVECPFHGAMIVGAVIGGDGKRVLAYIRDLRHLGVISGFPEGGGIC